MPRRTSVVDPTWQSEDDSRTLPDSDPHVSSSAELEVLGLTVLWHPDISRIGEVAMLKNLLDGEAAELSRSTPYFAPPDGGTGRPLEDRHLSRRPLCLIPLPDGGIRLETAASSIPLTVNRIPVETHYDLDHAALEAGAVLLLRQHVALVLHFLPPSLPARPPSFGLVGESAAMLKLRRTIQMHRKSRNPVLVRGETGTGKELIARALHIHGPLVVINSSVLASNLAADALFGHVRGAFADAKHNRLGAFQKANGGTLFLDEIGDLDPDVQAFLLRVESHQIDVQPLGSDATEPVDVRLVTATDRDLEEAMAKGQFRPQLYERVSSAVLRTPRLAERRDDFGRLFAHFLRESLEEHGEGSRLQSSDLKWIRADLVARLATYSWPRNVRQLRNRVRTAVTESLHEPRLQIDERGLDHPSEDKKNAPAVTRATSKPASLMGEDLNFPTDETIERVFREHRFAPRPAARALGIPHNTLIGRIRALGFRLATDLTDEEILLALERCNGRIECMVDALEVSRRGLKKRLNQIDVSRAQ